MFSFFSLGTVEWLGFRRLLRLPRQAVEWLDERLAPMDVRRAKLARALEDAKGLAALTREAREALTKEKEVTKYTKYIELHQKERKSKCPYGLGPCPAHTRARARIERARHAHTPSRHAHAHAPHVHPQSAPLC